METLRPTLKTAYTLPLFVSKVEAGFPSPANDHIETELDLQRFLIRHPAATYLVRAKGNSMSPVIESGDLLVVDCSVKSRHDDIVIASLNGDLTVKKLFQRGGVTSLIPMNPDFSPIDLTTGIEFEVWGVVTFILHQSCTHW